MARKKAPTRSRKTARSRAVAKPKRRRNTPAFPETGHAKDYCSIAVEYAQAVVADKKSRRHGKWIRLAAKRFFDDLKRAKKKATAFEFDAWHANDVCDFIEKLPHVEGVWETPDIVLHPSHVFFLVQLFGFRFADGRRRYTSALFNVARKNAKSTLAGGILLYCLCCEDEPGAQVISAATTFDQASIIFKIAKRMAEQRPALRQHFDVECFAKAIAHYPTGGSFKAIHAKASTQDGLNPSHTALDEIHAHKTPDLLNVLTSAAGARKNPLWLYTTTEGYENPGPWAEIRRFAQQLLEGVFGETADHFLALIYAVDDGDDEFDEKAWHKSNPLADVNPELLTAIRKEAVEAKAMPSKLAEFKIKRLNRRASSAAGWINLDKWRKCAGMRTLEELRKHPCTAAFDLSSTTDMTSWRLRWLIDGVIVTIGRRWVPADAVKQRTERGTVPYQGWIEAGLVEETPGDVVDYAVIEERIRADFETFNITEIGYDRWNAGDLVNRLVEDGLPLIEFVQGPKSYHPAMSELERAYISGKLEHGGDEVLLWQAANLVARRDANLNMAPDKRKSPDKIDDMCALLMAVGIGMTPTPPPKPSAYESRGVRTL